MKTLKTTILSAAVILVVVMMAATIIEKFQGTAFVGSAIYRSVWFVALWAVLGVGGTVYCLRRKMLRNWRVGLVHLSFVVILLGALVSWLTSESGTLHLRKGQPTNMVALDGGKVDQLDFNLKLLKFEIVYYPGTDAPMDYSSTVNGPDGNIKISMNNIGTCRGYRLTQSGYDEDMEGTILGVSYDPWGIGITYAGYALLLVALLLVLFSHRTRMAAYYRRALSPGALKALAVGLLLTASLSAGAQEQIKISPDVCKQFSRICVLYNTRLCPISTVATDFVTKLSGRSSWQGLSANDIFAGWVFDAPYWETAKMIEVKSKEVQRILGIDGKWAAFSDFWNQYNEYKLENPLRAMSLEGGDKKTLKSLREADEKFNVVRMLYSGEMLRMFPCKDKAGRISWVAPGEGEGVGSLPHKEWYFVRKSMDFLAEAIICGDNARAMDLAKKIYNYQHVRGAGYIPSSAEISAEMFYTGVSSLRWPTILLLVCALALVVASTVTTRRGKLLGRLSLGLTILMAVFTTMLLALRWIISGHLPLSNGYETMQFMAWAVLLLTLWLRRRFSVIAHYGPLLAAFALLVAMITDSNPQITQLMPVLQSPLLSIHVMVIMFSYALTGIMALTAVEGLLAHRRGNIDREEQLAALSRFLLYPTVALLTIGIFVGAVWANVSWGRYWGWDSKEVWALITLLIYAAPLHADIKWLRSSTHFHCYMLLAFLSVLMTYFGVNYFLSGLHSYA
jgi:cytochrome c-type biogenesis protein CcsB